MKTSSSVSKTPPADQLLSSEMEEMVRQQMIRDEIKEELHSKESEQRITQVAEKVPDKVYTECIKESRTSQGEVQSEVPTKSRRGQFSRPRITEKRNVIIFGKPGVGKSTLGNHILGHNIFNVSSCPSSVTKKVESSTCEFDYNNVYYQITVFDTIGILDRPSRDTFHQVKKAIKCIGGVHLFIFVVTNSRLTLNDKHAFELFHNEFPSADPISLMVITGCEALDKERREKIIREYRSNADIKDIISHMGKGILTVGFPDLSMIRHEKLGDMFAEIAKKDELAIRKIICESSNMISKDELCYSICSIQ